MVQIPLTPTRVLIVEDDEDTRSRLRLAVVEDSSLELCGQAGNCAEARAIFAEHKPQIVLVDLGLPDCRGTELIQTLAKRDPRALFIVLTALNDEANVVEAIEAGACSYLLKDASTTRIASAIREVMAGGSPISPAVARYLLRRIQKPLEPVDESTGTSLSEREREVLQLVAKGYTYAEIAAALRISVNTVGTYVRQTYRKLGVRSRGEAVFEAMQQGLLSHPLK